MGSTQEILEFYKVVLDWDWSDVRKLKVALEGIRESESMLKADLPATVRMLSYKTESRVLLPAHERPIIAVDVNGFALTGTLEALVIERLPLNTSQHR